jgi:2-polyprenyl-3-methyl-5-hydroxy-6-metoxy-1,4-benzoquinol methylase
MSPATQELNPWNADQPFAHVGWLTSAACLKHIQRKVSGHENTHWLPYSYETYMRPALEGGGKARDNFRCLILGANEGWMERYLCERGFTGPIVASDVADKALARAEQETRQRGYRNVEYLLADLNRHRFAGPFDFIIAEGVLHHVREIQPCLEMLAESLDPAGQMFMSEFVGPIRFQLGDLQTRWINAALSVLPRDLRPFPRDGQRHPATPQENLRVHYTPPSPEAVAAADPSEAICGPELKALLPQVFDLAERKGMGGTLLSYMTGHFDFSRANQDPYAQAWLEVLIHVEETLIETGVLDDDFVYYRCRRRA